MKKVLVTGFEPFGGEPVNPALETIKLLDGKIIAGVQVITKELPVIRQVCIDELEKYINAIHPDIVIAVGQAGGRLEITPERVAINMDDFRIKDNGGNQVIDEPIVKNAPTAYFSTLPLKSIVSRMKADGIPASVSNTAGTFVCNHLFYGLMHILAQRKEQSIGGFIHIPYLPEQAARIGNQPSMGLPTIVKGLELAIEAAIISRNDEKTTGGSIC